MKENIIVQKAFQFSLDIISLYKHLLEQHEYMLSKQLFRSGTSIGANDEEALADQYTLQLGEIVKSLLVTLSAAKSLAVS